MHRFALISRVAALALILNSLPARGQSAADFQVLEKQIQDLQAKVNKLQKEQADSTVNYSGSAGAAKEVIEENKLKLSAGVTEMKLYGDLRFRYQYDQYKRELDSPVTSTGSALAGAGPNIDQRDRWRFRLRVGADFKLGDQFFGSVVLATTQASDSNMQTYTEGYDNYNVFIDKAFAGWSPNDWFTVVLGKQANPFYTTDLVWDPDITPNGAVEFFDITKAFMPDNSRLSLRLVTMQGAFMDNNEFAVGADNKTDAWQFVEQLRATYQVDKNVSVTIAPGFMTYTAASLSGLQNSLAFSKTTDSIAISNAIQTKTTTSTATTTTTSYNASGVPTITVAPAHTTTTITTTNLTTGATTTVSTVATNKTAVSVVTTGKPNPSLANKTFAATATTTGPATTVSTPTSETPSGETRDLAILTAPGDISFKLGGLDTKVYWDFAYNTEGGARSTNEYFLATHSSEDDVAWLAGVQLGNNVHAGDWSFNANFRQVGMDSIDPNLNDSDFGLSFLNIQGVKIGVAYSFTDYFVGAVNYYHAWILRSSLTGGEATGGATLANAKNVDVLQVDLNLKF